MQICLSKLVDLALGKPHNLECDNFNFLHALLHVMLMKLNLADSRIELTCELAKKAEKLITTLPRDEPSVCFREYLLRAGGGKIRKRSTNVVCTSKSLIQINRKWPQCCASSNSTTNKSTDGSAMSTEEKNFYATELKKLTTQVGKAFEAMGNRISLIENEQKNQFETQNQINCAVMQEFQKLREKFDENITTEVQARKSNKKDVNANSKIINEIMWLRERILELSQSIKLNSECLRKLKCEEFPKVRGTQNDLINSLQEVESQILQYLDSLKSSESNEISELRCQLSHTSLRINEIESKIESSHESISNELSEVINKLQAISSFDKNLDISEGSNKSNKSTQSENSDGDDEGEFNCYNIPVINSLNELKKQFSSQSVCVQQILRDLSSKLSRNEFEAHYRQISSSIDILMQLKNDIKNIPNLTTGGVFPLSTNLNCISCHATANMTSTLPKMSKFGCFCDLDNNISSWSCYNKKLIDRKINGKVMKISMPISRIRQRRLKGPFKCGEPSVIYQNCIAKNDVEDD